MGSYGSYYVFTRSLASMAPRTKVSIRSNRAQASSPIRPHFSYPDFKLIFLGYSYMLECFYF